MRLKDFVLSARESLRDLYPEQEAARLVGMLCEALPGLKSYTFLMEPDFLLDGRSLEKLSAALERLAAGEPVQYVLGYAEFCGRSFKVNPSVLIPRPETEEMCTLAISEALRRGKDGLKILDLCTGSGCIAWTLALSIPGSSVVGVDVSSAALGVAAAQSFELPEGFNAPLFHQADIMDDDLLSQVLSPYGTFDIVISNPPYILRSESEGMRANVLDHEPELALFVPDDDFLVFNRKIAEIFKKVAKTDSVAYVEINDAVSDDVAALLRSEGLAEPLLINDVSERKRFVRFHL